MLGEPGGQLVEVFSQVDPAAESPKGFRDRKAVLWRGQPSNRTARALKDDFLTGLRRPYEP